MGYYHTAQVCLNGHMINDNVDEHPESNQNFCSKCGAKTITACPSCNAKIRGDYECGVVVIGGLTSVDSYCYNCGAAYPWTEAALQNTTLLIMEEEELSEQLKQSIVTSLPDIITETPGTNLATVRIKKCLASAGRFTADALRQFVIDFGCELAKKSLEL